MLHGLGSSRRPKHDLSLLHTLVLILKMRHPHPPPQLHFLLHHLRHLNLLTPRQPCHLNLMPLPHLHYPHPIPPPCFAIPLGPKRRILGSQPIGPHAIYSKRLQNMCSSVRGDMVVSLRYSSGSMGPITSQRQRLLNYHSFIQLCMTASALSTTMSR